MTYRGEVRGGVVILERDAQLPEGAVVRVELVPPEGTPVELQSDPLFRLNDLAVETGIPDLAINADHYLYGHPKVDHAR